jgi:uncharacterized protein YidB (DUF937 family)
MVFCAIVVFGLARLCGFAKRRKTFNQNFNQTHFLEHIMGLLDGMLGSVLSSAMGGGQAQDPKAALVQGVLGMLLNQGGGQAAGGLGGLAGALGGMLGGQGGQGGAGGAGALGNVLGGLLGGAGGQVPAGNAAGGLGDLLEAFTKNGMGAQADSWQGTGANMPISADQLSQVLGSLGGAAGGAGGLGDILGQLAGHAGVSREDAAGHLSEILPSLVDKLTPNGQVVDTSGMNLGSIMQQVLGKAS